MINTFDQARSQTPARTFQSQIGELNVNLSSDSDSIVQDFARLYPPSLDPAPGPAIHMVVRRQGRSRLGRPLFRVYGDGEEIGGTLRRSEIFPYLEWGINLRIIASRPKYLQLHAASMARSGEGFIFAGSSGCGKSTLAAGLLARGWKYYCDEFAMIHPRTGHLHPYPKALCIKSGSFPALHRLSVPFAHRHHFVKRLKGRVGYIDPQSLGPHAIADPAPIRFVLFPKYESEAQPNLVPISRAHALLELAGCTFNRHVYQDQLLPILGDVVRGAQCFRLTAGDLQHTCAFLESRLSPWAAEPSSNIVPATGQLELDARPGIESSRWIPNRRDVLRRGAQLVYVVPTVLTLQSQAAFAGTSLPSGMCSTLVQTGGLCATDPDCCSGDCDLGICK